MFFIDAANQYNPVPHLGGYEATNPCGEQPLLAVRRLQPRLDQRRAVRHGTAMSTGRRCATTIHLCTHFLDNVIDVNKYPLAEIDDLAKRIRRIGLGVMGLADLLVRLGIPYDSAEGVELGRQVMEFVDEEAKKESERLAEERGAFPEWEGSHLGARRHVRPRRARRAHPPDATAAQLQRHDRRAHRHDLDHRRLLLAASSRCSPWPSCATRPA